MDGAIGSANSQGVMAKHALVLHNMSDDQFTEWERDLVGKNEHPRQRSQ